MDMLPVDIAIPDLSATPIQLIAPTEILDTKVACAAYDIGSGNTKFIGAILNTETLQIEDVFSQGSLPVGYQQDLDNSSDNAFSDFIQTLGVTSLQSARYQIEQDYQHYAQDFQSYGEIQHFAVATAAFREANNGELVAEYFHQILDIPVEIISQEEEGKLAYLSASSHAEDVLSSPIVWDIGGGSMQLTFQDQNEDFSIMQGQLASQTFYSLVIDALFGEEAKDTASNSLHPMNTTQIEEAITLAKEHLVFDPDTTNKIKEQLEMDTQIIGVGSLHNFAVQPVCNMAGTSIGENVYTKDDLLQAISLLSERNDDEIMAITSVQQDFVKTQVTNLILVYAMMDNMNIDTVKTVKANNLEGLLLNKAKSKAIRSPVIFDTGTLPTTP